MSAATSASRSVNTPARLVGKGSELRLRAVSTPDRLKAELQTTSRVCWPVADYDLDKTLDCGQAFRWTRGSDAWTGVVAGRWIKLWKAGDVLHAETATPQADWHWLAEYLQVETGLAVILKTFPDDPPLRAAIVACRGLRLLRQEPWECLASFILSSTKQILQIRQVVELLCQRFGEALPAPPASAPAFSFPSPEPIARLSEPELRACKMGFRAPHLLGAARAVAGGRLDLLRLRTLALPEAREQLMQLDGVGPKIADCVLLFAGGFARAFPVDVWVERALRELYFRRRKISPRELREFAASHFGPHAGYAEQYLFHFIRTRGAQKLSG
jgi:N-glycosylase/DNA lyase